MRTIVMVLGCILFVGCASNAAPPAAAPAPLAAATTGAKPDREQAVLHLRKHVEYPASRAKVLAACAETPEFSEAEKKWFTDNLPDGSYASADDVMRALHL
jgi:hypothetical protein